MVKYLELGELALKLLVHDSCSGWRSPGMD